MYPNPVTNGKFSIDSEEAVKKVEIFDLTGKLIDFKDFDGQINNVHLNVSAQIQGLFLVKISLKSGQVQTKKLLFK